MHLGFIGTGTISTAVVHGLAPAGGLITVSERSAKNAASLATAYENVSIAPNAGVVAAADVLFIGLLPDHVESALAGLPFRAGQRIISFMADVPLERLAALCAPATVEALVLPFPAIAQTRAPLTVFPQSALVEEIFSAHDVFTMESEAEFAAFLRAQAALSPVAALLADAAQWAGENGADAAKAEAFLRALVASNLTALDLPDLLQALSLPGGYNARLRQHMEDNGLDEALRAGLSAL